MIKKLTLVVGFGAGYVLGAKAGKERYEQIMKQANSVLGRPEVKDVTDNLSSAVTEKASAVADTAKAKVEDLTSSERASGPDTPGAKGGPIPGAAASGSV